jgi:hypothetical protein
MDDMGTKKPMSFEEFERVYDDTDQLELLRGELIGPIGSTHRKRRAPISGWRYHE